MKKMIGMAGCTLFAGTLFATTYYWVANDPGSQTWADATDVANWSTAWDDTTHAPNSSAHPAGLPTSSDALWLCRDILLDLKGQDWTVTTYRDGKWERLNDGKEYYGAANHTFGVTNGTLSLTGNLTFRTAGGVVVENGGALKLVMPILDNGVPVTVRNGGVLTVSILQGNRGGITVEPGGSMTLNQLSLWSYAGAYTTTLINRGTMAGGSYDSFRLKKQGTGGTIKAGNRVVVRQEAGTWILKGPFNRGQTAEACPDLHAMTYVLRLSGGTVRCEDVVSFSCNEAVMEADASVTFEVAAGKSVDLTSFVYEAGTAVSKTGAGAITFSGAYPGAFALAAGTAYFKEASTAPVLSEWSLAAGTVTHLATKNIQAGSLSVAPTARIELDLAKVNVGDTLVTTADSDACAAFAAAVNASLGTEAVMTAVSTDGAVRLALTGTDKNTITVADGEETTWSAWVAEYGAPNQSVTLVKKGKGTLVVDTDLSAYTAGLRVEEGTWRGSAPVHFCANNSQIVVTNDGAALEFAATEKNKMFLQTRTLWLCGTGVDGKGVIYDRSTAAQQDWQGMLSGTVVLTGDTLIGTDANASRKDLGGNGTLDMNGHTLTVRRQNGAHQVATGKTILNPGHIVFDRCTFFCPFGGGTGEMGGGAANTITLRSGSVWETWGMDGSRCPWTLVWTENGFVKLKSASQPHVWNGPMRIAEGALVRIQGESGAVWTVTGPLTGAGTLSFNQHAFTVNLPHEGNDFTGVVADMSGDTLNYAGRVGGAGKDWSAVNAHVEMLGVTPRDLGEVTFTGAGVVSGGVGRVTALTKKGEGVLSWLSYLGGGTLTLEGGGVVFGRLAGLYEGRQAFAAADVAAQHTRFDTGSVLTTNALVTAMKYATSVTAWTDYMVASYDGYLWNRTSEDLTWNVHVCFDDRAALWIDGQCVIDQRGWSKVVKKDVTLSPGPHRFTLMMLNESGGKGPSHGNKAWLTAAGENCTTKGFAIKDSPGAGASADDYRVPFDDGTGAVFTPAVRAPFDAVSFAAGTFVDLGGDPVVIGDLTGPGVFRSGDVTVTGTWTVTAGTDAEPVTVDGTLTFAEGAVLAVDGKTSGFSSRGTVLATATGGVNGLPECRIVGVTVRLSEDGKSVLAFGGGLVLTVR